MIQRIHLLKLVENYLSAYFTFHQLRGKEVAESSRKKISAEVLPLYTFPIKTVAINLR